jgi:hypothetical protein
MCHGPILPRPDVNPRIEEARSLRNPMYHTALIEQILFRSQTAIPTPFVRIP